MKSSERQKLQLHEPKWINLTDIMFKERSQTQRQANNMIPPSYNANVGKVAYGQDVGYPCAGRGGRNVTRWEYILGFWNVLFLSLGAGYVGALPWGKPLAA